MPALSKVSFFLLVIFFSLTITVFPVYAQQSAPYTAETHAGWSTYTWVAGFGCLIQGQNFLKTIYDSQVAQCPTPDGSGIAFVDQDPSGGAIGTLNRSITAMYLSPPTSTGYYLADLGQHLGIQPVYAADQGVTGSGAGVIAPILDIWIVTRNMAYAGFILVFIAIGFMIMFRRKLNPQTVISVQSALPTLVIGLILVTLSYFIAAFIVDLSFILMQLVAFAFTTVGNGNAFNDLNQAATGANVLTLLKIGFNGQIFSNIVGPIKDAFQNIFPQSFINPNTFILGGITGAIGGGIGVLIFAVVSIAMFIQIMRLLWALIMAYITILINTILGPFFILASTIPGRGGALTYWWKGILGNVLIFPAVFAAFAFAGVILGNSHATFTNTPPLLEGLPTNLMRAILAYGIILATPAIPGTVKSILGVKDMGDIAKTSIGGFVAGTQPIRSSWNTATQPIRSIKEQYRKKEASERAENLGKTFAWTGKFGTVGKVARAGLQSYVKGPTAYKGIMEETFPKERQNMDREAHERAEQQAEQHTEPAHTSPIILPPNYRR